MVSRIPLICTVTNINPFETVLTCCLHKARFVPRGLCEEQPETHYLISAAISRGCGTSKEREPDTGEDRGVRMCKVLIADDSDIMRKAIRAILLEERWIDVVGESETFNETVQKLCDLKPDVLLMDVHLAEKRGLPPELVKAQLGAVCTIAVSFANGREAKCLAESYGARTLLDKMSLYSEMIPAIKKCQPNVHNYLQGSPSLLKSQSHSA